VFALATALSSRAMWFGAASFVLGMLPMLFVTPRQNGYVCYVPMFGLAVYAGGLFERMRAFVTKITASRIAAVALSVAFVTGVAYSHYAPGVKLIRSGAGPGGAGEIRLTAEWLPRLRPRLEGPRVLLIDAPFGNEVYVPGFTIGLLYRRIDLQVVNQRAPQDAASLAAPFDHTFVYREDRVIELSRAPGGRAESGPAPRR
jgi:hypothetical protein